MLGCGAGMEAHQRGLAFLGFYSSASGGSENSSQGLALLLSKKRDANEAFRRFLDKRIAKGGPLMPVATDGILVPVAAGSLSDSMPQNDALVSLARYSPALEASALLPHLFAFDGVRDKALWSLLQALMSPAQSIHHETNKLLDSLKELDKLLRMHSLANLTPLIRRALLCTWMSSDTVSALLELWSGRWPEAFQREEESAPCELCAAARACVADLPKFFAGAVLHHADRLVKVMTTSAEDARAATKALASIAKRAEALGVEARLAHAKQLGDMLLEAYQVAVADTSPAGLPCRKVVRALKLLPSEERTESANTWLAWAWGSLKSPDKVAALRLTAALFEDDFSAGLFSGLTRRADFLKEALGILSSRTEASDVRCAAIELVAAAGAEEDVLGLLSPSQTVVEGEAETKAWLDPEPSHAVCCLLRVLRSGRLRITTRILAQLAAKMKDCLGADRPTCESEKLLQALQRLQQPSGSNVRLADRLRICLTLPSVFAFSSVKKQREAAQRMLQASFMKASRRAEEPLLEFALACFIHFLSSIEVFRKEASVTASSFPNSSKMCSLLCESLLRSDTQHAMELACAVLQVCDRTLEFVDREQPASDAVHKAASVLRYVIERCCPSLAGQTIAIPAKSRMPAELFAARQNVSQQRALPSTGQKALKEAAEVVREELSKGMELVAGDPGHEGSCSPSGIFETPKRRQSLLKSRRPPSPDAPNSVRTSVAAVARPMGANTAIAASSTAKKRRKS